MRTTLNIDDHLLAQAKEIAARSGRTLGQVVEDALRQMLSRCEQRPRTKVRLKTVGGTGLRPGVSLDDSDNLLDRMEGRN